MSDFNDKATVSGSVVLIENGADEVGAKSCVVTVSPTLSGVSSVTETQTGKNLLNGEDAEKTANNIRFYYSTGKYYLAGTYTLSISENVSGLYVRNVSTSTNIATKYNSNFITFTLTEKTLIGFDFYKVGINHDDNVMLEVGSTATAYEPYQTPTQYTASLGRTIYGGTADIANGVGTDGYIKYVIDGVNNYAVNISGTNFNIMPYGLNIDGTINKWLCDAITASSTNFGYNSNQGFIFIRQAGWSSLSGVTDVASFNAYCQEHPITLILPLATPTDFTFTGQEVPTRLGYNAFWSEQGNTELTYYKSGYGYTSVTVNQKDGNDELIATKTAKLHKVIYGGEVDVIQGTAEPKNLLPLVSEGSTEDKSVTLESDGNGIYRVHGTATGGSANPYFDLPSEYTVQEGDYLYMWNSPLFANASFNLELPGGVNGISYALSPANRILDLSSHVGKKISRLRIYVVNGNTLDVTFKPMICKSGTETDYVPSFTPFTFPPISMETVEGTNVLYANEGDSTVTYRRSAD